MGLSAQAITFAIGGVRLLEGVDLTLRAGEITAVLGPNGAGKTSLLRVLCGELRPQRGSVTLAGRSLHDWSATQRARLMAVLPQHSLLDFPFTAEEVVMLGRSPHDSGAARDRQVVAEALAAVDGDYLARREYTRLSGGEKQRVHLARVLAQIWESPPWGSCCLLLDEPTASFDLAHQRMTLDIVRGLGARGVAVLMVLHDLNLAARCADQLVLMECGRVVASGSPETVLTPALIREVFRVEAHIGRHPQSGTPLVIT